MLHLPADTGTLVIRPNVTNIVYVTATLNCIKMWKTERTNGGKFVLMICCPTLVSICSLPNIRTLAVNRIVQDRLSHGITSAPVKYKPKLMGQHRDALIKPSIVNVNAIWATGGSPMTLRNITCNDWWFHEQGISPWGHRMKYGGRQTYFEDCISGRW